MALFTTPLAPAAPQAPRPMTQPSSFTPAPQRSYQPPQYPGIPGFQPAQTPALGSFGPSAPRFSKLGSEFPGIRNLRAPFVASKQQQLLGPLGQLLGISSDRPLRRKDIPLLQANLAYQNRQQSEQDRLQGYNQLLRARNAIGQEGGSPLALRLAMEQALNPGFGQDFVEQQTGALRNQAGLAAQDQRQRLAEDLARRGVAGGGIGGRLQAELEQSQAGDLQRQLSDFSLFTEQARGQASQQALQNLTALTQEQEGRRAALDQALGNVFLETERQPIDLSDLLVRLRKGGGFVQGGRT